MINTNVATVGIRGGIVAVDSDNETTSAAFVYGRNEVIPLQTKQENSSYRRRICC